MKLVKLYASGLGPDYHTEAIQVACYELTGLTHKILSKQAEGEKNPFFRQDLVQSFMLTPYLPVDYGQDYAEYMVELLV